MHSASENRGDGLWVAGLGRRTAASNDAHELAWLWRRGKPYRRRRVYV